MSVAVIKTKAEQALTENFAAVATRLPGSTAVTEARSEAIGRFGAAGLPHRRIEEWKYTDLRNMLKDVALPAVDETVAVANDDLGAALGPLNGLDAHRVVFVEGCYRAELSTGERLAGVEIQPLGTALVRAQDKVASGLAGSGGPSSDPIIALNTAYMTDGAIVRVAENSELEKPLLLVFVRAGAEPRLVSTRNIVSIGSGAKVTLIEAYVSLAGAARDGQCNTATEIVVGNRAAVSHVKIASGRGASTHLASWMCSLGAAAIYRPFQFTLCTGLARNQLFVTFKGEGSKLDLSGAFLGRGAEHIDTTLLVDHAVPHCESRELFKGVLDGHARGIFQGKIIVRPDAQKTDGKQMAQALMLSPDAEFDSKPELEIYADDVVCGHGSTAAEIDENLLFYCQSRGISKGEARALLIESFIGEAIEKVEHEGLREAMMALARGWLAGPPA